MTDGIDDDSNQVFGLKSNNLLLNMKRCLKSGGVIVSQANVYQQETLSAFKKHFPNSYGWTDNFNLAHANSFVYAIK